MLEMSLLGVGTVLPLGRDAWSMVKSLRRAHSEHAPPPPLPLYVGRLLAVLVLCAGGRLALLYPAPFSLHARSATQLFR